MVTPARSEPGCWFCDLFTTEAGSTDFVLLERCKDGPAREARRAPATARPTVPGYRTCSLSRSVELGSCVSMEPLVPGHEPSGCRPSREVLRHGLDIDHKTFYNVYSQGA